MMISVATLMRFDIFANLNEEFLEALASISEEKIVQKGEWLFHEGDKATSLYLIINGQVELKLSMDKLRNLHVTLNTLGTNDAFGWSSMIDPYIYRLGALGSTNTQLVRINGERLRTILEKYPEEESVIMHRITKAVGSRLDEMSEKAPELSCRLSTAFALWGFAGFTTILIVIYAIYATVSQTSTFGNVVGSVLLCAIVPICLFVFAYLIAPSQHKIIDRSQLPRGNDMQHQKIEQHT